MPQAGLKARRWRSEAVSTPLRSERRVRTVRVVRIFLGYLRNFAPVWFTASPKHVAFYSGIAHGVRFKLARASQAVHFHLDFARRADGPFVGGRDPLRTFQHHAAPNPT